MSAYRELRYWSAWHDGEVARLSMVDDHGQEFYRIVPADTGKRWREVREEALTVIEDAIRAGCLPGEVR